LATKLFCQWVPPLQVAEETFLLLRLAKQIHAFLDPIGYSELYTASLIRHPHPAFGHPLQWGRGVRRQPQLGGTRANCMSLLRQTVDSVDQRSVSYHFRPADHTARTLSRTRQSPSEKRPGEGARDGS
jgi:hypothetical protein